MNKVLPVLMSYFNKSICSKSQINYINFWTTQQPKDIWFSQFIDHYKLLEHTKRKIYFHSVLGMPVDLKKRTREGVHIFYSGENMQAERFEKHRAICDQKPFDFSMGFEYIVSANYMRFPLWIISLFDPTLDYKGVKKRVKELSEVAYDNRKGFCSLVASHDWNGIRGQIMDQLSDIGDIASGGRFRNNTDDLNGLYNNNKQDFISQYKFNICPENSDAPGYVTEKLFQAIDAGCIPIYWGSGNNPEPEIINQNACVFWNEFGDNENTIRQIMDLYQSEQLYREFTSQPRLIEGAEDTIWDYYIQLKNNMKTLFV